MKTRRQPTCRRQPPREDSGIWASRQAIDVDSDRFFAIIYLKHPSYFLERRYFYIFRVLYAALILRVENRLTHEFHEPPSNNLNPHPLTFGAFSIFASSFHNRNISLAVSSSFLLGTFVSNPAQPHRLRPFIITR